MRAPFCAAGERPRTPRGFARGAERVADLLVAEVVAVAKEDRGALRLRQVGGQPAELLVGKRFVDRLEVRHVRGGDALASPGVERHVAGDRQGPGAEIFAVLELRIRTKRPQERLLERVVRLVAAEQPAQLREHGPFLLLVEPLEGGNAHGFHHPMKRGAARICEIGLKVLRSGEMWFTVGRSGRCC
jgi:hypothetical protein